MILLLGGTSDAEKIADKLAARGLDFTVSVATDYGRSVTKKYTDKVIQGRLDSDQMASFIAEHGVKLIIDGTHPFANLVSEQAIKASQQTNCHYLRYERQSFTSLPGVTYVASSQAACEIALQTAGKIYLTVGSKTMADYVARLPLERIKTRVLPVSSVITQLEGLGLNSDHIEALKGPFSVALNVALLQQSEAGVLITKESGATGGLLEKSQACQALGIPCLVIERPKVNYPAVVMSIEELDQWLEVKSEEGLL